MLKHTFVSAKSDGADATLVRPGNWNAEHTFDGGTDGQFLQRDSTAVGIGASWAAIPLPAGLIAPFAGVSAPSGWLLCNGAAVSRSLYAALFTAISTIYGVGDGSTTFNLPDMRGRSPIGAGQGSGLTNRTLGGALGAENHTLSQAEMPAHAHGVSDPGHTHTDGWQGGTAGAGPPNTNAGGGAGGSPWTQVVDAAATGISIQNAGSGGAHNNMQPSLVVNFIVKT